MSDISLNSLKNLLPYYRVRRFGNHLLVRIPKKEMSKRMKGRSVEDQKAVVFKFCDIYPSEMIKFVVQEDDEDYFISMGEG